MKKKIALSVVLFLLFAGLCGIVIQRVLYTEVIYDTYDIENLNYFDNPDVVKEFAGHIRFENESHTKMGMYLRNQIYNELAKIPPEIRAEFINRGWKIFVGKEKLSQSQGFFNYNICGITNFGERYIAVKNKTAIFHEFGHFYQGLIGKRWTFGKYYRRDKDAMKEASEYGASSQQEFFATVFECYIEDKNEMHDDVLRGIKGKIDYTWNFFTEKDKNHWIPIKSE